DRVVSTARPRTIVVARPGTAAVTAKPGARTAGTRTGLLLRARLRVQRLGELVRRLLEPLPRFLHALGITRFEHLLRVVDGALQLALRRRVGVGGRVGDRLLGAIHHLIELDAGLDLLALLLVLGRVDLALLHHPLDL